MWWGGREALDLKKRNAAYQELCDAKAGSDKYVPRAAQTLNPATKDKACHAVPPPPGGSARLLLTVALQRFNSKGRSLLQVMGLFL